MEDLIEEEIMVLKDIYPKSIEFTKNFGKINIYLSEEVTIACSVEGVFKSFKVKHLPPISFTFEFHDKYPELEPPGFILTCAWLSTANLSSIGKELDELWERNGNMAIVYNWIQFLQLSTLESLGMTKEINVTEPYSMKNKFTELSEKQKQAALESNRSQYTHHLPRLRGEFSQRDARTLLDVMYDGDLLTYIKNYDKERREEVFRNERIMCNVCFTEKKGRDFVIFKKCKHLFCRVCVKEYFEIQIKDGNVKLLNCMQTPCDTPATPSQVYELVGDKLFQRYDELLLTSALSEMPDVRYCPRTNCQCAVISEPGSMMAMCPKCTFSFCVYCKAAYHGINPCKINRDYELFLEEKFKIEITECGVCLTEKKGGDFVIFEKCKHAFCKECVKEYFEMQIKVGSVTQLNCMQTPCESPATVKQIYELVNEDLFERYNRFLLSSEFNEISGLIYCPQPDCYCPIFRYPGTSKATCAKCGFLLCVFCKKAYHGTEPCFYHQGKYKKLFEANDQGNQEAKKKLRKLFGDDTETVIDETRSLKWVYTNSRRCPTCKASIFRDGGCAHMKCNRCGTDFCFLCLRKMKGLMSHICGKYAAWEENL